MSNEHTIAIVSFEGAVKREVARIRNKLKPAAESGVLTGNEFTFDISASGRILDGEVKLSFTIKGVYGINAVTGNSPDEVMAEYLRRAGWEKVNTPLALSSSEEIPF